MVFDKKLFLVDGFHDLWLLVAYLATVAHSCGDAHFGQNVGLKQYPQGYDR
jgi:hypothetical protein